MGRIATQNVVISTVETIMRIQVEKRGLSEYTELVLYSGDTTIRSGLLDDKEAEEMALDLLEAIIQIGPHRGDDCAQWIKELLDKTGINIT